MALADAYQPKGNYPSISIQDFGQVFVLECEVVHSTKQSVDITGPKSDSKHAEVQGNVKTVIDIVGYHGEGPSLGFQLFPSSLVGKTIDIPLNNGLKFTGTANVPYIRAKSSWQNGAITIVAMRLVCTGAVTQSDPN